MAKTKDMKTRVADLLEKRITTRAGGGQKRVDKQHAQGKLTARERIEALIDPDSFQEIGLFRRNRTVNFGMDTADMPADGVVTGTGAVLGRPVHIASQDFTVAGGSAGETHSKRSSR